MFTELQVLTQTHFTIQPSADLMQFSVNTDHVINNAAEIPAETQKSKRGQTEENPDNPHLKNLDLLSIKYSWL